MRWRGTFAVGLILVALAIAGAASAQEPGNPLEQPPPVSFEDQTLEEPIVPLSSPGTIEMMIGIGCDALETPETVTTAEITTANEPRYVEAVVSPASASWTTEAGDCPSEGPVYEDTFQVSVVFTQDAPAFEEVPIRLEMTVQKEPPVGEARTYGPFVANATATPGYFDNYDRRVDSSIQDARADEVATFEIMINNFSNGETRFDAKAAEAPDDVVVEFDPDELVLKAGEAGTLRVDVSFEDPSRIQERVQRSVTIDILPSSTHPLGGDAAPSTAGVLAQFDPVEGSGLASVSSVPVALGLSVLLVVAALRRRTSHP